VHTPAKPILTMLGLIGAACLFLALTACSDDRSVAPSTPGPIKTVQTDSTSHVSTTQESFVTGEANAVGTGDKVAEKANKAAIPLQEASEYNYSAVWLSLAGIIVCAVGAAAWYEFGSTIGGGILAGGGALIITSFVADALFPYRKDIAFGIVLFGAAYEAYRHVSTFKKLLVQGEALVHVVEQGVIVDVKKIGTEAYTLIMKISHLFQKKATVITPVVQKVEVETTAVVSELKTAAGYRQGGPNG
jgi:hypothetical protein